MKKTNNKGFSLVELIVVVAIMAVLMVVVAPQMLRYVERTRIQRDNSAIAEIANAAKIAMADETINKGLANSSSWSVTASNGVITFASLTDTKAAPFVNELTAALGATVTLSSNAYASPATPGITVSKDDKGNVTVAGAGLVQPSDGTTALTITY